MDALVRCLEQKSPELSRRVVAEMYEDPFWVERGEPYRGLAEGTSEAVRRNFKLVDKVEVDFTYR